MATLSEKRRRLVCGLQIDSETKRSCVMKAEAQAAEGLFGNGCFGVPQWLEAVAMSSWLISAIGVLPSLGSTWFASGLNHRPAAPSPFNSALRASKQTRAMSFSTCRLRAASRLLSRAP